MRTVVVALLLSLALPAQAANMSPMAGKGIALPGDIRGRIEQLLQPGAPVIDAACCMVCHKGKACGDACISRDKTCHVGPGCACQGN